MRNTLVTALAVMSLSRLVLVVGPGRFSAQSVVLCLSAAPTVLGTSFLMNCGFAAIQWPVMLRSASTVLVLTGIAMRAEAICQMA